MAERIHVKNAAMRILLFILFLILNIQNASAQISDRFGNDTEWMWEQQKDFARALTHSDREDLIRFASVSALTLLSKGFLDEYLNRITRSYRFPFSDTLFMIDRYYGDKFYTPAGVLLIYTGGLVTDNDFWRDAGRRSAGAYLSTGILTMLIKQLTGRSRPFRNEGPRHYRFWPSDRSGRSFPSGHTSTTFAVSTVMASRDDHVLWKTGWYSAAFLVGAARMYNDQHWFSDVLFGGFMGHAIGTFFSKNEKSNISHKNEPFMLYLTIPF